MPETKTLKDAVGDRGILFDVQVITPQGAVTYHGLDLDAVKEIFAFDVAILEEIVNSETGEEVYAGRSGEDEYYITRVM